MLAFFQGTRRIFQETPVPLGGQREEFEGNGEGKDLGPARHGVTPLFYGCRSGLWRDWKGKREGL
jgi:hypothetical protein